MRFISQTVSDGTRYLETLMDSFESKFFFSKQLNTINMKKIIFLFLIMFMGMKTYAQVFDPRTVITQKHSLETGETLEVPVVFHIVDDNPNDLGLNEQKLKKFLRDVNNLMNGVSSGNIDPFYRKDIGVPNIKLVPIRNGGCEQNIPFLSIHSVSKTHFNFNGNPIREIHNYGYVDAKKVLNIWIVDLRNSGGKEIGYAMKPYSNYLHTIYDGVVINNNILNQEQTYSCFIHELGHYFGLEHIWADTNDSGDGYCNRDDYVTDTPNQGSPNIRYGDIGVSTIGTDNIFQFSEIKKVCGDSTTAGNYQNFMDYAYEAHSMFTEGQVSRMRYLLLHYRSGLFQQTQCSRPQNDECSDAKNLSVTSTDNPEYVQGSVFNATAENFPGDPISCDTGMGNSFSGRGVWYRFSSPTAKNLISVKRAGSKMLPTIALYKGGDCRNLSLVECKTLSSGSVYVDISRDDFVPNEEYYVRVYHANENIFSGSDAEFSISVQKSIDDETTPKPNMIYVKYKVKDGTGGGIGNDDGAANTGESIDLDVLLKNTGNKIAESVSATLSTLTPGVTVTDSEEYWGDINPGQSEWEADFDFDIDAGFRGSEIKFTLVISSGGQSWRQYFTIPVTQSTGLPELEVYDTDFDDNDNDIIESGDSVELDIKLENSGRAIATDVSAKISCSDSYITITDDTEAYRDISVGARKWCRGYFNFKIADNCPDRRVRFYVDIRSGGQSWRERFYLDIKSKKAGALKLEVSGYRVKDGRGGGSGNRNGKIEPGESIDLDVRLKNIGSIDATRVKGYLYAILPEMIDITDNYERWDDIDAGDRSWEDDFDFDVSADYVANYVQLRLEIKTNQGEVTDYISIPVNQSRSRSVAQKTKEPLVTHDQEQLLRPTNMQAYVAPNPLQNNSRLHLILDKKEFLHIDLYSLGGKKIKNIFSGDKNAGKYSFAILDGHMVPSGMYVLNIIRNGQRQSINLIVK